MPRLTKKSIDAAEPRGAPYFVWDSELPGFGIRVFPTGRRVYYADYRTKGGTRRRAAIGAHGVLTLDEARKLAKVTLADVIRGGDPIEEARTRRESMTVAELCADYLAAAEAGKIPGKGGRSKRASTIETDRGRVSRHIVPLIGKRFVRDITTTDVQRVVDAVIDGKTACVVKTGLRGKAVVTGGPATAARVAGLLGSIFTYAIRHGVIENNPVRGVKRPTDRTRDRRLNADEYRALGAVLARAEADAESWQGIVGVRLLALTGCRLNEIARLQWSEINMTTGVLTLSDSKEGRSIRPLGEAARRVLKIIERRGDHVLPGPHSGVAFGGLSNCVEKYAQRAKLKNVTPHTLRHSFASTAGDLGFSEITIASLLGHSRRSVTSKYVNTFDAVLLAAATRVADSIASELGC